MATKSVPNIKEKAIRAALALAADRSWHEISLRDIARKAKISLKTLHENFDDRLDILAAWIRRLDRAVLAAHEKDDPEASPRDRLFDILMDRFEALNEQRGGAKSILRACRIDPKQDILLFPHLTRSMSWMLEAAGIDVNGPRGGLRIAGLTVVYLKTLWVWCDDDSADLSKTMAALDRDLGRAENLAQTLGIG